MKRKSLRALAVTLAAVQILMLVPTAKVSASTDSLTGEENLEEDTDEESTDDESTDEESTDEESTDEVTHLLKT